VSAIVLGVGPGLGAALVQAYAETGRPVAAVSRSGGAVPGATGYAADLGQPAEVRRVVAAAAADLGPPDIVHYNASVLIPGTPSQVPLEAVETAWRVGCLGAWASLQASAPLMDEGSAFFVTGGGLALNPWPPASALASAKAALRNFVQAAAAEQTHVRIAMLTVAGVIGQDIDADEIARHFLGLLEMSQPPVETVVPRD
jgi:NAD(P)-dependent dehydrogenase (short-subunit alcohol dehydrogenase family)